MAGRPTKYSEETVEALEKAIRLGATYSLACKYAGISLAAFEAWKRDKSNFCARIEKAEGDAAANWLTRIEAASAKEWQAAAWKLERRYPQDYGRKVTEIQGKDGGPVEHTIAVTSAAVQAAERAFYGALPKPAALGGPAGDDRPPDQG